MRLASIKNMSTYSNRGMDLENDMNVSMPFQMALWREIASKVLF